MSNKRGLFPSPLETSSGGFSCHCGVSSSMCCFLYRFNFPLYISLPETNSSPLKIDAWKTILPFLLWHPPFFSGCFCCYFQGGVVFWLPIDSPFQWMFLNIIPYASFSKPTPKQGGKTNETRHPTVDFFRWPAMTKALVGSRSSLGLNETPNVSGWGRGWNGGVLGIGWARVEFYIAEL